MFFIWMQCGQAEIVVVQADGAGVIDRPWPLNREVFFNLFH